MIQQKKSNAAKTNLYVDFALGLVFLVILSPGLTGLAVHEWLGFVVTGVVITHLLLHWQWLVTTTRRLFSHLTPQVRINVVLNTALFIAVTVAIFSGFMISEVVLPFIGVTGSHSSMWRGLHSLSANTSLALIGLHIAMHWKWVVRTTDQYMIAPLRQRFGRRTRALQSADTRSVQRHQA